MQHRPEVDGLRAVAIIPVVFFHAGFALFSGGFVGVDVFFVISGYLITSIILEDLRREEFSLLKFYERRARRILPALFFVIGISSAFAWYWMSPSQFKDFAGSVFSTTLFVSNMFFWRKSGYFDAPSEERPLLHTWSLAVEEQYYVLFPIFIILTWRFKKERVFWALVAITFASFALSEWGWRTKPIANFFLAPTRAWEILVGSLVAFLTNKHGVKNNNIFAVVGLIAVFSAVLFYDKNTPFPSYYSLLPVLGTASILLYGGKETLTAKILSAKPMIFIGLISYSVYLWHQPIFAFSRISPLGDHSQRNVLLLCAFSLVAGYLSWKYVERPFRNRAFLSRNTLFALSGITATVIVFASHYGVTSGGMPQRLSVDEAKYLDYFENDGPEWRLFERLGIIEKYRDECNFYDTPANRMGGATLIPREIDPSCVLEADKDAKTLFLWGDSYAMSLNYGLKKHIGESWNILQVASSGCAPDLYETDNPFHYCERSNYIALKTIKELTPEIVVLKYNKAQDITRDHTTLRNISLELLRQGVENVAVVGPLPHWNPSLPETMLRFWPDLPLRTSVGLQREFEQLDEELEQILQPLQGVTYLSAFDALCTEEGCLTTVGQNHTNEIMQWDDAHLSPKGSIYLIGKLLAQDKFRTLLQK